MGITIRNYKPSDYENLKENLKEGGLFDAIWDSEESMRKECTVHQGSRLIAEVHGVFAGSIHLIHWGGNGCFLFHFAVKKQFRRKGIGIRLLQEAEKRLKKMGAKQVGIFVDESNKSLINYYKKQGYTPFMSLLVC